MGPGHGIWCRLHEQLTVFIRVNGAPSLSSSQSIQKNLYNTQPKMVYWKEKKGDQCLSCVTLVGWGAWPSFMIQNILGFAPQGCHPDVTWVGEEAWTWGRREELCRGLSNGFGGVSTRPPCQLGCQTLSAVMTSTWLLRCDGEASNTNTPSLRKPHISLRRGAPF